MPTSRSSVKARRAAPEAERSRWSPICPRPRRWMLPAEWKRAEISARRQQPRFGAIAASSARTSSESAMALERQEPTLVSEAEAAVAAEPCGGDDAMAGQENREPVPGAEAARRAGGAGAAGQPGELAVADDVTPGHPAERLRECRLEGRSPLLLERDVRERDGPAGEVRVETLEQLRHEPVALLCRLVR